MLALTMRAMLSAHICSWRHGEATTGGVRHEATKCQINCERL